MIDLSILAKRIDRLERRLESAPEIEWQKLEKFCEDTGYQPGTVREYRKRGVWPDGIITKCTGRRILVNIPAYNRWVETGRAA